MSVIKNSINNEATKLKKKKFGDELIANNHVLLFARLILICGSRGKAYKGIEYFLDFRKRLCTKNSFSKMELFNSSINQELGEVYYCVTIGIIDSSALFRELKGSFRFVSK